jgi:hypothetical protein
MSGTTAGKATKRTDCSNRCSFVEQQQLNRREVTGVFGSVLLGSYVCFEERRRMSKQKHRTSCDAALVALHALTPAEPLCTLFSLEGWALQLHLQLCWSCTVGALFIPSSFNVASGACSISTWIKQTGVLHSCLLCLWHISWLVMEVAFCDNISCTA